MLRVLAGGVAVSAASAPYPLFHRCTRRASTTINPPPLSTPLSVSSSFSEFSFSVELSIPHLKGGAPPPSYPASSSSSVSSAWRCGGVEADYAKWVAFLACCDDVLKSRPSFVVFPCKEPYFCDDPSGQRRSTMQMAAQYVQGHRRGGVPAWITVNATIPASHDQLDHASSAVSNGTNTDQKGSLPVSSSAVSPYNGGATSEGVRDVLRDYVLVRGGSGLVVVRGDAQLRRQDGDSREFQSGADLLKCVREELEALLVKPEDTHCIGDSDGSKAYTYSEEEKQQQQQQHQSRRVTVAVAGYPQGHWKDRSWAVPPLFISSSSPSSSLPYSSTLSVWPSSIPKPREVVKAETILQRVRAARQLREVPSSYPPEVSQRCIRELVTEKLLPSSTSPAVRMAVVTQMLTSAEEFIAYAQDVQAELNKAEMPAVAATGGVGRGGGAVKIVPSLIVPSGGAEAYSMVLRWTRVIPSARILAALVAYETALSTALLEAADATERVLLLQSQDGGVRAGSAAATIAEVSNTLPTTRRSSNNDNCPDESPLRPISNPLVSIIGIATPEYAVVLDQLERDRMKQEARFTDEWHRETVEVACALVDAGHKHLHLMAVVGGSEVGRDLQALLTDISDRKYCR